MAEGTRGRLRAPGATRSARSSVVDLLEAQGQQLEQLRLELHALRAVPPPSLPFGQLADRWLAAYLPRAAPSSREDLRCSLARLLGAFRDAGPEALDRARVEAWLSTQTCSRSGNPISRRTFNKLRWVGRAVLQLGTVDGLWNAPNAFALVKPQRLRGHTRGTLDRREACALIYGVRPCYRALFAAAVYTGARKSELIWWRREDVDLKRGLMSFRRSAGQEWTKNGTHREGLPIHRELLPLLLEQLASHASPWVFPNPRGERHSKDWDVAAVTRRALTRLGIPKAVDFHGLRRTSNTLYRKAGTDALVRRLLLGHAVRDVNDAHYTELDEAFMRSELEKLTLEDRSW